MLQTTFILSYTKKYINVANKITNSIHLIEDFCLLKTILSGNPHPNVFYQIFDFNRIILDDFSILFQIFT